MTDLTGIVQGSGSVGGVIGETGPTIEVQIQSSGLPGEVDYDEVVRRTTYHHAQQTPTDTWHIAHNLGFYPSVFVADSGGNWVVGDVEYVDENNVIITFNGSFSGDAYFS